MSSPPLLRQFLAQPSLCLDTTIGMPLPSLANAPDLVQQTSAELGLIEHLFEVNDSAVQVLGDETLRTIAQELVESVRRNTSIDWTVKESVRARLRVIVKRILRKYGYPPDKQESATVTVLQQAELLSEQWVA